MGKGGENSRLTEKTRCDIVSNSKTVASALSVGKDSVEEECGYVPVLLPFLYEICVCGSTCLTTLHAKQDLLAASLVGAATAIVVQYASIPLSLKSSSSSSKQLQSSQDQSQLLNNTKSRSSHKYSSYQKGMWAVAHFIWAACLLLLAATLDISPIRSLSIAVPTCLAVASFSELLVNHTNGNANDNSNGNGNCSGNGNDNCNDNHNGNHNANANSNSTRNRPLHTTLQSKWSILLSVVQSIHPSSPETRPLDIVTMALVDAATTDNGSSNKTEHASPAATTTTTPAALTSALARQTMFAKAAKGRIVSSFKEHEKYVILEGYVFNVASFAAHHPGGTDLLLDYGERHADITDQFAAFHNPALYRRLLPLLVGKLQLIPNEGDNNNGNLTTTNNSTNNDNKNSSADAITSIDQKATTDYRKLNDFLWANGYFNGAESDPESARICVYRHLGLFSLGVLAVFQVVLMQTTLEQSELRQLPLPLLPLCYKYAQCIVAAVTLGMFWQQVAFTAHDACHNCVVNRSKEGRHTHKLLPNNMLGWFHGSVLFGISSARWTDDHSVHHAFTMRPLEDAQFKYLPIWCASRKEFDTHQWQTMKQDFPPIAIITKCLLCVQHWTLLPFAVIIGRFNFYIINIIYAIQHKIVFDLVGMGIFWLVYYQLMSFMSQDVWIQVCFTLVSHATVGILHVQLLVNHLATDAFTAEEEQAMGWFPFQIRTTRNIDSNLDWDWFHGGLQYQIEHHLFPQLPRHRLPLIQPALQELCARNGLNYESVPLLTSVRMCLANFKEIADEVWAGDLSVA